MTSPSPAAETLCTAIDCANAATASGAAPREELAAWTAAATALRDFRQAAGSRATAEALATAEHLHLPELTEGILFQLRDAATALLSEPSGH